MQDFVFCFDENYARPTIVAATSLLKFSKNIDLHFLYTGVKHNTLENLKQYFSPESAHYYEVPNDSWAMTSYSSHLTHVSKATNLRLLIPELLGPDIHKVVYLDSDVIVNSDLKLMNTIEIPESGVAARRAGSMASKTWGKGVFPRGAACFSAGVLVLNLKTLRFLNFGNHCREILNKVGPANDQTILNLWCRGNFGPLPLQYNMRPSEVTAAYLPYILHFEGCAGKPWDLNYSGNCKFIWDNAEHDVDIFNRIALRLKTQAAGPDSRRT
jgi:lipopolysaccharide biosynthesis glycosyltransferase